MHLHCLRIPLLEAPFGDWYCPQCCKVYPPPPPLCSVTYVEELKLPEDYLPVDVASSVNQSNNTSPIKKKRKKRGSNEGHDHHLLSSPDVSSTKKSPKNVKEKRKRTFHRDIESPDEIEVDGPLSAPSRSTVGSREKALESEAILDSYEKKLQEFCFVCRVEENKSSGQLLLCDFPDCNRAYHTVSRIVPFHIIS